MVFCWWSTVGGEGVVCLTFRLALVVGTHSQLSLCKVAAVSTQNTKNS